MELYCNASPTLLESLTLKVLSLNESELLLEMALIFKFPSFNIFAFIIAILPLLLVVLDPVSVTAILALPFP